MSENKSISSIGLPLDVSGLCVTARSSHDAEETVIVDDVSFSLSPGEVLALIGETGSGKSTIALSLMGYARRGCHIASGRITLGETSILELSRGALRKLCGDRITYIAQSAAAAFNPSKRLMDQVIEGVVIHGCLSGTDARRKARQLFTELGLPEPETIGERYPHELSGGQLQRVMAAMALISDPALIILDEPTTALDVTTQVEVLQTFKRVVHNHGATAVYVSHDLAVVAQMADKVLVLNNGCTRELGEIQQIIDAPVDDYTKQLLQAARTDALADDGGRSKQGGSGSLLEVSRLNVGYGRTRHAGEPDKTVLHDVSLKLNAGGALGIIGESGSGKSTLAHTIAGLVPAYRGQMHFQGDALPSNLKVRTEDQFRELQMVFQSADNALNGMHSVRRILSRPLQRYYGASRASCDARVRELLDLVQLPSRVLSLRPPSLSGGQKQRVNLARALAAEPKLVICDEVTSALDTVVGEAILNLLGDLRRELGVAYLFISHDISTVRRVCDDVMVLYQGRCVEYGRCEDVIDDPQQPYTRQLINSIPQLRTDWLAEQACHIA